MSNSNFRNFRSTNAAVLSETSNRARVRRDVIVESMGGGVWAKGTAKVTVTEAVIVTAKAEAKREGVQLIPPPPVARRPRPEVGMRVTMDSFKEEIREYRTRGGVLL
jgi:hypothetical protein